MGTISEKCCLKKKEEAKEEEGFEPLRKPNSIETIITDRGSTVKITYENNLPDLTISKSGKIRLSNSFIFTNLFYKDPFESYNKIEDISPPNLLKVSLKTNQNIIRLMIIIENEEIMNDDNKKKAFEENIKSLQSLDHPNINKIFEVFIFDNKFYLITSHSEENNLLEKIKSIGVEDEDTLYLIMNQILNSVVFLHENNIYNFGLALDKILIYEIKLRAKKTNLRQRKKAKEKTDEEKASEESKKNEDKKIKQKIEIRISTIGYLKEKYDSDINSIIYYPPEILEQIENNNLIKDYSDSENDKLDEWACGMIMYYLITGEFPFKIEKEEQLSSNIKNTEIDFCSPKFEKFSKSCIDLLSKLLEKDKNKRINANECINHPFIKKEESLIKEEKKEEIDLEILKNLLEIKKPRSKFHELINAYLCFNFLDKKEEQKLNGLFKYIDQDHNNVISDEDIKIAFRNNNINYTDKDIENILYVFDYDQNNLIQYQEFLRVLCDKDDLYKEENMRSVFDAIDTDKNQFINAEDIQKFVPNDEETKNKVIKEFMQPFGMKEKDTMIYEQFCEIIIKDKTFDEVENFKSRLDKIRKAKMRLTNEINKNENEENEGEK